MKMITKQFRLLVVVVVWVFVVEVRRQAEARRSPETPLSSLIMEKLKQTIDEGRRLHQQVEPGTDLNAFAGAGSMVDSAKERLVELVRDRLLERFNISSMFEDSMEGVLERYIEAEERGELSGMDENQKSAYLYRLAHGELHALRGSLKDRGGHIRAATATAAAAAATTRKDAEEDAKLMNTCLGQLKADDVKVNVEQNQAAAAAAEVLLSGAQDEAEEEEQELWNELEDLGRQEERLEDEMGLYVSPEVREKLKRRTMLVMTDLFNNEIRQLALAMLNAFISGNPVAGGVVAAIGASLRVKLVEYLMNMASDIMSSVVGAPIELKPVAA